MSEIKQLFLVLLVEFNAVEIQGPKTQVGKHLATWWPFPFIRHLSGSFQSYSLSKKHDHVSIQEANVFFLYQKPRFEACRLLLRFLGLFVTKSFSHVSYSF